MGHFEEISAVDAVENVPIPCGVGLVLLPPKQRHALCICGDALLHLLQRHLHATGAAELVVLCGRELLVHFARQAGGGSSSSVAERREGCRVGHGVEVVTGRGKAIAG